MNILLDELPRTTPNGYEISTDFRDSIKFELLMQDNTIDEQLKVRLALNLYYKTIPTNIKKGLSDLIWFYKCEKEGKKSTQKQESKKIKQIYSYEFDDKYIYSAFLDQYQIDLNEIEYMHWWKFKSLFQGLKEDNLIVKIMGYRSVDLGKIKDKDEKKRYKELQKLYALPDMRTTEQKEADFGSAFW